jgi:hypothetical protein
LAFMWQWGHSQRVEMGSNSRPQKSQGTGRPYDEWGPPGGIRAVRGGLTRI